MYSSFYPTVLKPKKIVVFGVLLNLNNYYFRKQEVSIQENKNLKDDTCTVVVSVVNFFIVERANSQAAYLMVAT